jgi:hypothetical protein
VFIDDGISGTRLDRPALERLRDLVAEGVFEVLLVTAPDRLARRYAYQVVLIEEFIRGMCGGPMDLRDSKIVSPAMAKAARGAPRPNGSRSGCPHSLIQRSGSGRKPNSHRIGSGHCVTTRSIPLCCGVCWSVGVVTGAWSALGAPKAGGISMPSATHGMCRGHAQAVASVRRPSSDGFGIT